MSISGIAELIATPFVQEELLLQHFGLSKADNLLIADMYQNIPSDLRPNLSIYFDRVFYLSVYADVAESGIDALLHYVDVGFSELRQPHPLINPHFMRAQDETLFHNTVNMTSYLEALDLDLVLPTPYFDYSYYKQAATEELGYPLTEGLFRHFLGFGLAVGLSPNRFFCPRYYIGRYDDFPPNAASAVYNFVLHGDAAARAAGPLFDGEKYLRRNTDVADSGIPPLRHYLVSGRTEERDIAAPTNSSSKLTSGEAMIAFHDSWQDQEIYARVRAIFAARKQREVEAFREHSILPFINSDIAAAIASIRFEREDRPKLSILIPVYNELQYTVECLLSLASLPDRTRFEVIVADDGSPEKGVSDLANIANLVYVRQEKNQGFLRNCNMAFSYCRGEYVLLLNNDTQVLPQALDALVDCLDQNPNAAAAGAKLLYPNGRLQEAGCYVDAYGGSHMIGLFEDPQLPIYCRSRKVEYCSGAALAVRKSFLFGGLFDEAFAPAYCEDTDLCLGLLSQGYDIFYVPDAVVVHHLSVSTAKESQLKKLQQVAKNQEKILEKWGTFLESRNKVRILAFYLPQFHPTPQNDLWWGVGFTEWTNVARTLPSYQDHYQPHLPADLGFYDLRHSEIADQQGRLAQEYGVSGFCVYYYNFSGVRVLDVAFERIVLDKSIHFPYCVCWANENWTKHWDGGTREVLLGQSYDSESMQAIADDFARYAADPRYITVNGSPLFLLYRPLLLPDVKAFAQLLRDTCVARGLPRPHLVYVESMEAVDKGIRPADIGFDACVEFPPHGRAAPSRDHREIIKSGWDGYRYDYEETALAFVTRKDANYTRYPAAFPSWDNTPRQPLKGTSFDGATPAAFQAFMEEKIDEVLRFHQGEERLLFVNAWNEWAEGAHLEPDQRYGHRWLASIRNALTAKSCL